jgi:hypothetical protein
MGISLEEYLKDRQACSHCEDTNNQEHCVTELLSREDSCIFYNVYTKVPPDGLSEEEIENDVEMLTNLRTYTSGDLVLEYYIRASKIIKELNANPNVDENFWEEISNKYVTNIVLKLRMGDTEGVTNDILTMLNELDPATNERLQAETV